MRWSFFPSIKNTGLKIATRQRSCGDGTPFYRDAADTVESVFEQTAGADQRKAKIVFAVKAEGGAGDGGNAHFFKKEFLHFLRGKPGVFNVDPGVESAFRRVAAKAGNFGQRLDEEVAAKPVLGDHGIDRIGGVAQSFDGGNLNEFRGACESVEDQQVHGIDDFDRSYSVAE